MMQTALFSKAGGRKVNEDYCSFRETGGFGCFLLADGLGSHRGGALAAKLAGGKVLEAFTSSPGFSADLFKEYLEYARCAFLAAQENDRRLAGMKTTLVILLSDFRRALWGHIGDSRLYHFRSGRLRFQTKDHSVPQRLADSGVIAPDRVRFHEDRNRLTRAFDGVDLSRFEFLEEPVELRDGDAFLLCSDGFWEYVLEAEMEKELALAGSAGDWLGLMEKRLLKRAQGKYDNYSALASINGPPG